MEDSMEAKVYCIKHSEIEGRGVWHYMIDSPVGQVHLIQYEKADKELVTEMAYNNSDKASRTFKRICMKILGEVYEIA